MINVILLTFLFCIFTALSIVLTGDRGLISGDLSGLNFLKMVFQWRFICAMILAVGSRFTFIFINNSILKIPSYSRNSTTLTAFITAISYIFIILTNFLILKERLSAQQIAGAIIVLTGIFIMFK
jgi:drug/metabolite transporter (DMT)-like permease